ncbi:MAG: chemotaxis response regulator protein-glutamate methylesterase [Nitrospirae bacterium]|nr:chemotaxis response regulator protein-glutamate methylesterase [Nitrospirota bacterium]
MTASDRIRTLLVDDSHFMRLALQREIAQYGDIEVVDAARNGEDAVEKVLQIRPDVVVMDVRMPVMDGIAAVRRIMDRRPTPVIMLSAYTREGASETLEALAAGAVDFVSKPSGEVSVDLTRTVKELVDKVRAVRGTTPRPGPIGGRPSAALAGPARLNGKGLCVVVIGASTGGPSALEALIPRLPEHFPAATIIVQHMPPEFTGPLSQRLDRISRIRVREAQDGDNLEAAAALLVPGNSNLTVAPDGRVRLNGNVDLYPYRPCIDVTLKSVSEAFGSHAAGVLLTGMGHDGAEGLRAIKGRGGRTMVQDEKTSVIYSMPQSAVLLGCVDRIVPVDDLASALIAWFHTGIGAAKGE